MEDVDASSFFSFVVFHRNRNIFLKFKKKSSAQLDLTVQQQQEEEDVFEVKCTVQTTERQSAAAAELPSSDWESQSISATEDEISSNQGSVPPLPRMFLLIWSTGGVSLSLRLSIAHQVVRSQKPKSYDLLHSTNRELYDCRLGSCLHWSYTTTAAAAARDQLFIEAIRKSDFHFCL